MPTAPPRHAHRVAKAKQHQPPSRESAAKRGYDRKWQKARAHYLKYHRWCAHCLNEGRHTQATDVDHIVPHRGDYELFWDESNWQPLCRSHHSVKTAREDGGFGR